jgi:ATP-dependent RNA circularization protein (DNA/RNA ligase family)
LIVKGNPADHPVGVPIATTELSEWRRALATPSDDEIKQREAELGRAVMNYLTEHPHAMDSVQGIAEWWVMRQRARVEVETLVKVLQQLVDEARVEKVDLPNGPLYRLRR